MAKLNILQHRLCAGIWRVLCLGRPARHSALSLILLGLCASAGHFAWSQTTTGRGAPDPLRPDSIVGSEGKGYYNRRRHP